MSRVENSLPEAGNDGAERVFVSGDGYSSRCVTYMYVTSGKADGSRP